MHFSQSNPQLLEELKEFSEDEKQKAELLLGCVQEWPDPCSGFWSFEHVEGIAHRPIKCRVQLEQEVKILRCALIFARDRGYFDKLP